MRVHLALRTRCRARDCSYIHVAAKIYMLRACETSIPFFLPLVIGFVDRIAARGRKAVDQSSEESRGAAGSKYYEEEARWTARDPSRNFYQNVEKHESDWMTPRDARPMRLRITRPLGIRLAIFRLLLGQPPMDASGWETIRGTPFTDRNAANRVTCRAWQDYRKRCWFLHCTWNQWLTFAAYYA